MKSPYPLTSVVLDGFTSFASASVELGDLNVLIGPNGAGKSNFLAVFDMLGALVDRRLGVWFGEQGGPSRVLFGGLKRSQELRVTMKFNGGRQGYEAVLGAADGGTVFFVDERAWGTGQAHSQPFNLHMGSGHRETRLHDEMAHHPRGVAEWTLGCLSGWTRYHFHDTSRSAGIKQAQRIADSRALRRDGSNLAPFLYRLQQTGDPSVRRIRDAVRTVAPFFDDFVLQPDAATGDLIRLEWRHTDNDLFADAAMMSDGTLRFLCLATVLLQPDPPSVVLIDEPELGLHPYAINQLAELMKAASNTCQVVVSTQSVTLLDQITIEDVMVTERIDGSTHVRRLDRTGLDQWLDTYSVGDLWVKNLIDARPRFA